MNMKKLLLLSMAIVLAQSSAKAQSRLIDRSGTVRFYSSAPMEDIEATNNSALGIVEIPSGKAAVSILIKGFKFEKALMQEHFNENYMESDKYPKATFSGQITDPSMLTKLGSFQTEIQGQMTLHGVTKDLTMLCQFNVSEKEITVKSTFNLVVADYDIEIPKLVRNNIAKEVEVTANFKFQRND